MLTITLLVLAYVLILVGILGSILPALPGPPIAWVGLLLFYFIPGVEINYWILSFTLLFTIIVAVLDYIVPAKGTKKFGGSSYGVWGTNIGLIAGIFFPPFGFILGPFLGALIGEMIFNSSDKNRALKAAFGSFIGFLASVFMKVMFCIMLLFTLVYLNIKHWNFL